MTALLCPQGHESAELDFCSVCGTKIPPASLSFDACPDCRATREPINAAFCEVCGFNFTTGSHGEIKPMVDSHADTQPAPGSILCEIVVAVDSSLRSAESPEPPVDFNPVTLSLDKETILIGRLNERRGIFPEVSLDHDSAVSHRHALLTFQAGAEMVLRDIGSSNGTRLNGEDLTPLTDHTVKSGDTVTLGHWTRLIIRNLS